MNYRHAFHAGNHADVLKHIALQLILERLRAKTAPFAVLDTHAGAGLYDLASDAALRSPEWQGGIGRLWDWTDAPVAVRLYLDAVRAQNAGVELRFYPGSPAIIAHVFRTQDRYIACELHPEEAAALKRNASAAHVHVRDGYEALRGLLPFPERRGLVLIDPPFEAADELAIATRALKAAHARFRNGVFLLWRPLKDASALDAADAELPGPKLRADLWVAPIAPTGRLAGSSLLILNPPFGVESSLRDALPALANHLATAPGAGWRVSAQP